MFGLGYQELLIVALVAGILFVPGFRTLPTREYLGSVLAGGRRSTVGLGVAAALIWCASSWLMGWPVRLAWATGAGITALCAYQVLMRSGAGQALWTLPLAMLATYLALGPIIHFVSIVEGLVLGEGVTSRLLSRFLAHWSQPTTYFDMLLGIQDRLPAAVFAGAITTLIYALLRGGAGEAGPGRVADTKGGWAMHNHRQNAMRQLLASAVLLGSSFRTSILQRAQDAYHRPAPEIGLDLGVLVRFCRRLERRQAWYDAGLTALGAILLAAVAAEGIEVAMVVGAAMLVVVFVKRFGERFRLVRPFQHRAFDADAFAGTLAEPIEPDELVGIPEADDNVTVYQGFVPFVGAGVEVGTWSLSIDVTRPKRDLGHEFPPKPFALPEVYAGLEASAKALGLPDLEVRSHFFVSGLQPQDPPAVASAPPARRVEPERAQQLMAGDTTSPTRHYQWIRVTPWGGDLALSFFVRFSQTGKNLLVEVSRYFMPPLDERYRKVDALHRPTWPMAVAWAVGTALLAPFLVIGAGLSLCMRISAALGRALGSHDRARRRETETDPCYNWGAATTLRQTAASTQYAHYFQRMDKELYQKSVERQILDTLIDFLDTHNIDTSDLRERQSTILNTGLIVQGGDVKAQSLAVGSQAKATLLRRRGASQAAPAAGGA